MSKKMDNRRENFVALGRDAIDANDIQVPERPKKLAVVEYSDDFVCFIIDAETQKEAAGFINISDTECTHRELVDLDNPKNRWTPWMKVFNFRRANG